MFGSDTTRTGTTTNERTSRNIRTSALLIALLLAAPILAAQAVHAQERAAPEIASFEPTSGTPGVVVWVNGSGFSPEDVVLFGGTTVSYTFHTNGSITFVVPELAPGNYAVEVDAAGERVYKCCFTVADSAQEDTDQDVDDDPVDPSDGPDVELPCREPGMNMQCNVFGTIKMPNQKNIRGEPVQVVSTITLERTYAESNGRFVLFSIRNVTDEGGSPVAIVLNDFSTPAGDIITTRVDKKGNNELNLWVHVMDVPTGVPITLDVQVGSASRGAYILETLVMVFDKGYDPVRTGEGQEASLYSYTLLGVNDETKNFGVDGAPRVSVPGPSGLLATLALLGVALVIARRGRA